MKHLKSTIIIIMLTILFLQFSPIETKAETQDNFVKIGLKYGSSSVASVTIQSESGFILGSAEGRSFTEGMPLPAYTKLVASNENGNIVIRDEAGTLLSANLGSTGCIMPANYQENGILSLENTTYRDGIMLLAKSDGTMSVINYITLEHYVYGVLNSELGYTNPKEALKAQAVAARSFGELNLGKHSADGFDLCASTHCQVYKGYSGEYPSIIDATDETKGEMIYYNGTPVTAFYFKNSGGYTQNVEDVWTFSQPYLKSVKDEYCPSYPWSTSLSFDTIQTKLIAAGFSPGTIQSVSIQNRNSTGAVCKLKIVGNDATVYLEKEKIRNVLGSTIIKSNIFSLGDSNTSGFSSWKISNGLSIISPSTETYIVSANGTIRKLQSEEAYVSCGTSTLKLGSSSTVETVTSGTVTFNGYGYGHGVGMPQDSAIAMAKLGITYDEILKYYYTDIEIK